MAIIDIILIVIAVVAAVWGYSKGFIAQVGSLAAIVVGVVACRLLGPQAVEMISGDAPHGTASYIATAAVVYSVLYIVAYYAVILLARVLKLAVHTVFLGPLDRIGGALFNLLKCFIMVSFVLNLYAAVFPSSELLKSSTIGDGKPLEAVMELGPAVVGAILPTHDKVDDNGTE